MFCLYIHEIQLKQKNYIVNHVSTLQYNIFTLESFRVILFAFLIMLNDNLITDANGVVMRVGSLVDFNLNEYLSADKTLLRLTLTCCDFHKG